MNMKLSSSRTARVAKWCFVGWLILLALGVIMVAVGLEDPGQSEESQPFGGLLAIFGDFQFNFPEQFVVIVGIGVLLLNLAGLLSIVAIIASSVALRSSGKRGFQIVVLLTSLPMAALVVFYWISMLLQ